MRARARRPTGCASLFEASWAYFQDDGDSKALGNIHTLNSPYFENEFYPERCILKAVIYFKRCNYDRSQEAINEFNDIYPDLRKEVDAILAKYPDNAQFYDYVLKIKSGEAGLSERVQNAAAGALSDRTLLKNIDYVNELDRELKAIDKADPAWKSTAVAGNILQDLTLQKSLAANDAGKLARNRLQRLSSEIQELIKQAIKIEYETLQRAEGRAHRRRSPPSRRRHQSQRQELQHASSSTTSTSSGRSRASTGRTSSAIIASRSPTSAGGNPT